MSTATKTYTGRRMMDVRVQIAADNDGLALVDKITAKRYVITTVNGMRWNVWESNGCWHGGSA